MGRPLNKKYFGNRNIGTSATTDSGIGGEGVASASITVAGSYTASRPSFTFTAPELPTGVTATGTITSEVLSAAIAGTQTRAYPAAAGALSFVGGTTTATFTATLRTGTLDSFARASATTVSFTDLGFTPVSGNSVSISGGSITGTMTIGGTAIAAGQVYYMGAPTTSSSATLYASYSDAVDATNPLTIVTGSGTTGATFTYGATYGNVSAVTPVNRGSFEALVAGAQNAVCDTYGAGLTITPTYRAAGVVITEKGSGYAAAPTVAGYTNRGGITVNTIALTTDSGNVGSSTNQENAIVAYYYDGSSLVAADIIRQVSTDRYKIKKSSGSPVIGKLTTTKADGTFPSNLTQNRDGYELNITAIDASGGTYLVKKLTGHKAVLVPADVDWGPTAFQGSAGSTFAPTVAGEYKSVAWKFAAASGTVVQIANA